jgi:hypothetical protein
LSRFGERTSQDKLSTSLNSVHLINFNMTNVHNAQSYVLVYFSNNKLLACLVQRTTSFILDEAFDLMAPSVILNNDSD